MTKNIFTNKYADKSVLVGLVLIIGLYIIWIWSVSAQPPFADMQDWQQTDFSKSMIDFEDVVEGGPGKDGIPSLDQPKFVTSKLAAHWLDAREPVIAYLHEEEARAYPLQILMYHEIVNDKVLDQAIAVTYCPLCNSAMVFSRRVQDTELEFGVAGKVYNSNLIMFDRQSQSWWLQFTGQSVVGEYSDTMLDLLPSQLVSFEQFSESYPSGKVLSRYTGFNKRYGVNPYGYYDSRDMPVNWFYRKPFDKRIPAMQRVLGVVIDDVAMTYPLSELIDTPLLQTTIADQAVLLISKAGMASAVEKKLIKQSKDVLAAAAFSRQLEGRDLDFQLKGNQIIDNQTKSVWNMFGQCIQGELVGARLKQVDRGVYFAFV